MGKRTNTAVWEEKYSRWRIAVQKDGVRRQFYSSTPGRTGQREANKKADLWLDEGIDPRGSRVEELYKDWYASLEKTTGAGNCRNVESRWRTRILPAVGKKRITGLTEQDLQDVVNDVYSDGLAKQSLQSLCADIRAFVLSDLARAVLEQQRAVTGAGESVFELASEAYYKRWQVYCKANSIPPISVYELRHSFVSVIKSLPAGEVRGLVGHSQSMDTFGVYSHALSGDAAATADDVERRF